MKKTALAAALLIASGTSQSATLEVNAIYDMNILADGISCFTFGDCTTAPPGAVSYFIDNDADTAAALNSADPSFGSAIAGDSLAGNLNISTTGNGSGGVNFTVNSYNLDTFLGTAGQEFATMVRNTSTMSGSVDSAGLIILDTSGRTGMAATFNLSLGESAWNLDTHDATAQAFCNAIQTGSNTLFTTGSSTNINCVNGVSNLTLTGSNLSNSLTALLVSAGNVGGAWGFFDGVPYTEVFSVQFVLKGVARNDAASIDQGTSTNTINVLSNDFPASGLTISSVNTSSTSGTVSSITSGVSTNLQYTPPTDTSIQSDSITYTMSDGTNSFSANVAITINDKTAPIIVINGADPTPVANGSTYTELGANCTDNFDTDKPATVGGGTVNVNIDNTYVISYTCSDNAGNAASTVTRNVIVSTANQAPAITINGADPLDVTATPNISNSFTEVAANSDVSCADDQPNPILSNDAATVVDTSVLGGPFTITYSCIDTDATPLSATQVTRTINVVDNIAPVLTINGANPTNIVVGNNYTELGASCSDVIDSNPVITITPSASTIDTSTIGNTTTITYTCTDASNNSVNSSIDVVTISSAPTISLNGNAAVTLFLGQSYSEQGAICNDDVDVNKSALISGDTVDTSVVTEYTIRYNCTDSDGLNATEVTRTVTVVADTEAPSITLNGQSTININQGFTYFELGAACSDNADENIDATIAGDIVDTNILGTYNVEYNCADSASNTSSTTRTVIINSAELPPADEEDGGTSGALGGTAVGCSISGNPLKARDSADWLIVAGFLVLLAFRRRKKT